MDGHYGHCAGGRSMWSRRINNSGAIYRHSKVMGGGAGLGGKGGEVPLGRVDLR